MSTQKSEYIAKRRNSLKRLESMHPTKLISAEIDIPVTEDVIRILSGTPAIESMEDRDDDCSNVFSIGNLQMETTKLAENECMGSLTEMALQNQALKTVLKTKDAEIEELRRHNLEIQHELKRMEVLRLSQLGLLVNRTSELEKQLLQYSSLPVTSTQQ